MAATLLELIMLEIDVEAESFDRLPPAVSLECPLALSRIYWAA
jgi:hypothetical protein